MIIVLIIWAALVLILAIVLAVRHDRRAQKELAGRQVGPALCQKCQAIIPKERLEVLPGTRLCLDCSAKSSLHEGAEIGDPYFRPVIETSTDAAGIITQTCLKIHRRFAENIRQAEDRPLGEGPEALFIHVKIDLDCALFRNGKPVRIEELEKEFFRLERAGGGVLYYNENADLPAMPRRMAASDALIQAVGAASVPLWFTSMDYDPQRPLKEYRD